MSAYPPDDIKIQSTFGTYFYVVRVNGDTQDSYAAEDLSDALELAAPDDEDSVEFTTIKCFSKNPNVARQMVVQNDLHSAVKWQRM